MFDKSLVFILFILFGFLLQRKIAFKSELNGLKVIILSIALPATIFIALLSIRVDSSYLYLPVGALLFNLVMLGLTYFAAPLFGIEKHSTSHRTMMMLLPSLAPGLSCFPFLAEYLGDEALALGALADVGNKIFVLILLYLLAMRWYQQINNRQSSPSGKLKSLVVAMFNEPINMVMIVALVMVISGFHLEALPVFLQDGIGRAAMIMTPLVLLFIGLSVKIKWKDFRKLFFMLSWRSGIIFLISEVIIGIYPEMSATLALLIVVFPQSATSFWPFAHMTAVNQMEGKEIFDTNMAISILACSLPFSTLTIMLVFSFRPFFQDPLYLALTGGILLMLSLAPYLIRRIEKSVTDTRHVPEQSGEKYRYAE